MAETVRVVEFPSVKFWGEAVKAVMTSPGAATVRRARELVTVVPPASVTFTWTEKLPEAVGVQARDAVLDVVHPDGRPVYA